MSCHVRWGKKMSGDAWVEERQYAGITTPRAKGSERRLVTWVFSIVRHLYINTYLCGFWKNNVCSGPHIYLLYFLILNLCMSVCVCLCLCLWVEWNTQEMLKQNHMGSKSLKAIYSNAIRSENIKVIFIASIHLEVIFSEKKFATTLMYMCVKNMYIVHLKSVTRKTMLPIFSWFVWKIRESRNIGVSQMHKYSHPGGWLKIF